MAPSQPGFSQPGPSRLAWERWALGAGVGFGLLAPILDREIAPRDGEAALLGWLRIAAGHPVRCAVAVALLVLVLSPKRGSQPP